MDEGPRRDTEELRGGPADQHFCWTKADSPFLFLAACRELVAALSIGPAYVCHLPVSFDGSCSGLQHLSAAMRARRAR
jgi:DNA-directed RNA polymerase